MSLNEVLDYASVLPDYQQQELIDIIRMRLIEKRRNDIAENARLTLNDYHNGELESESAEELISRLHSALNESNS
jgi:hypothetical protein